MGTDGGNPGNTVRCFTDLSTCCNSNQGIHRGDWFFPDGDRLQLASPELDIFERHVAQRVSRNNAMGPSGIYRCDIATDAVHDDSDLSVRDTVYVGLYAGGGIKYFSLHISIP